MKKRKISKNSITTNHRTSNGIVQIIIRAEPRVDDPREMETILLFSLRSLFGDCETYSWRTIIRTLSEKEIQQQIRDQEQLQKLQNVNYNNNIDNANNNSSVDESVKVVSNSTKKKQQQFSNLLIECPIDCIGPVRSALTFVTLPPYIPSSTVYCFDVVSIQEQKKK